MGHSAGILSGKGASEFREPMCNETHHGHTSWRADFRSLATYTVGSKFGMQPERPCGAKTSREGTCANICTDTTTDCWIGPNASVVGDTRQ